MFLSTYLSGGIEIAPDSGIPWRNKITPFLTQQLNLLVYDPCKISKNLQQKKNLTFSSYQEWKKANIQSFTEYMKQCVKVDSQIIKNRIDFMIVYWDKYCGTGTISQIALAKEYNIPTYMVTKMKLNQIGGWILGCEPTIFENFEDLKCHLIQLHNQQYQTSFSTKSF